MNHREIAYALLRVTMGVIFLFYGVNKFISGVGSFVGTMNQQFSGAAGFYGYAFCVCNSIRGSNGRCTDPAWSVHSAGVSHLWPPVDWADVRCGHVGAGTHCGTQSSVRAGEFCAVVAARSKSLFVGLALKTEEDSTGLRKLVESGESDHAIFHPTHSDRVYRTRHCWN